MSRGLSTTAYAVLGMLALRPATPYELAQQMQRSLDYCWPTSERSLYDQPDRLVAAGLAEVQVDAADGGRRRYAITPDGTAALRAWLASDTAMPRFQNEPLLRVLLGDLGTLDDVHATLSALRDHLAQRRERGIEQLAPYLEGEGLYQERAHIVALFADLLSRVTGALDDWAEDVLDRTSHWDATTGVGMSDATRALMEEVLRREQARVERAQRA